MEPWQISYIQKNLEFLISNTICGPLFLAFLEQDNILSKNDISVLEATKDRYAKSKMLYEIVITRKYAYKSLVEALRETSQTGSLRRLEQARAENTTQLFELKDINELTCWRELADELKNEMRSKLVEFQGKHITLNQIERQYELDSLTGKIMFQMAKGEIPCIVNNLVPDRLEYYVHRTVTSRSKLKLDILQCHCDDVFVIEGLEKHQLSPLLRGIETTDVSGNQLMNLSVRFILLEHKTDFEKICKLATPTPVHWIKYENEKFELMVSSGSVENLLEYVDESQDSFLEDELASGTKNVYIIADSPGMGKTSLLANIAHQIMRQDEDVMLVRFIVLTEFVNSLSKNKINTESIIKSIAEQSSQFEFGRKLVEHALKTKPCVLLFDGFDEVLPKQIGQAKQVLQLAANLSSVRILVATRPHFRNELENSLNSLGYTIQPFDESNQIIFLLKYWKLRGAIPNNSLTEFTTTCVQKLTSNMSDSDRNIAGIPLQCRMLADTYEIYAIRCSEMENTKTFPVIVPIDSIFGMYESHMNLRFQKISADVSLVQRFLSLATERNQYECIKQVHMYYAFELLFPDRADQFKYLNTCGIPLHKLCGLGILEATHSKDIRFVHRTFAEFLVAWFVYERKSMNDVTREFVRSTIFEVAVTCSGFYNPFVLELEFLYTKRFLMPVICYFINAFVGKDAPSNFAIKNYHKELFPINMASVYHNYEYIPFFALQLFGRKCQEIEESSNLNHLLITTAKYCGVSMMKLFCSNIEDWKMTFMKMEETYTLNGLMMTPLHVAVYRGHYNLVEYLLKLKMFESRLNELRYLIHFCVCDSGANEHKIVEEKIQIIKLLHSKNKEWIDETLKNGTTPLMQHHVHVSLLECLIQVGADVNACGENGKPMLEKVNIIKLPPESFHRVVKALSDYGYEHFKKYPNLIDVVKDVELEIKTLRLLHSNGSDLYAVDFNGDSVLFNAITAKRSVELVNEIVRLVANLNHRNWEGQNVLHISAKCGNLKTLKYFIEIHKMDVNIQDVKFNTPLHYAVLKMAMQPVQQFLIMLGANVNAENEIKKTPFMLAFELGEGLSVATIKHMEENGLNINVKVASKAFKLVFYRLLTGLDISGELAEVLEYLIHKGGKVDYEFIDNIWNSGVVQVLMQDILQHAYANGKAQWLQSDAKIRGLLTEQEFMDIEKSNESARWKQFYKIVKQKAGSLERLYLILKSNMMIQTAQPLDYLTKYLKLVYCKLSSTVFVTPNPRLQHFFDSENAQVIILLTDSIKFSIRRIQDTIYTKLQIIDECDLINVQMQNELVLLKCEIVTDVLISKLLSLNIKFICVCSQISGKLQNCEIIRDNYTWEDVSSSCLDKLFIRIGGKVFHATELFVNPNIIEVIWNSLIDEFGNDNYSYHNYKLCRLVDFKFGHVLNKPIKNYLSIQMFHYFLPDKFVFVNTDKGELRTFAKYGHKIGNFGDDIESFDFILIQQESEFAKILKPASTDIHLLELQEEHLKLIRTRGSDSNTKRFFEGAKLCAFPYCSCDTSEDIFVKISHATDNEDLNVLSQEINLRELLPAARKVFGLEDLSELFRLRKLFENLQQQAKTQSVSNPLSETESNSDSVLTLVDKVAKQLQCSKRVSILNQIAMNTLFSNLTRDEGKIELSEEACIGLLEWKDGNLVFPNEAIAWYFVTQYIVQPEYMELSTFNELKNKIFLNCFEPFELQIPHCFEYISSFKFTNNRFFKLLNSLVTRNNNAVSNLISKYIIAESAIKLVHACINDNFLKLLEIVIELGINTQIFKSPHLIVLAVNYADVSVTKLVVQYYEQVTKQSVKDIQLEFMHAKSRHYCTISVFHIAALRGNYPVLKFLLDNIYVKNQSLSNLLEFCVLDTSYNSSNQVCERKRILQQLHESRPSLFREQILSATSPLLASNIHLDLLIQLIQLGVDIQATDEESNNILHLCPQHMNPQEYDKLVHTLYEMGETDLFHSRNKRDFSPFQSAVKYLDVLDSTISVFSTLKVDFNASNKFNSIVSIVVSSHRSARLLELLIKSGVDTEERGHFNRTVLHMAARWGNLTAVRYLTSHGSDINAIDDLKATPLHLVVKYCVKFTNTHEIVQLLVENGANVNAINDEKETPLSIAAENYTKGKIEKRTVEFLRKHEESTRFKFKSLLRNLQNELVRKNMGKLIATTNCDSDLLQKLVDHRVFTKRDLEEFKVEADATSSASKFYTLLLSKKYDYISLLSVLEETNQTEALAIFIYQLTLLFFDEVVTRTKSLNPNYRSIFYSIVCTCSKNFQCVGPKMRKEQLLVIEMLIELILLLENTTDLKSTPLHLAFSTNPKKQLELVQMLVAHNADVNARDSDQQSPLHKAVQQKTLSPCVIDIIKLLIENGADPNAVDKSAQTFLHYAPRFFSPHLYHELISYLDSAERTDVFTKVDYHRCTPLHCAVLEWTPLLSTLELFRTNGVDFNAQDNDGNSAVFYAIGGGRNAEFLKSLFTFGVNVRILNKQQENVLHCAAYFQNISALKYLMSLGCNVDSTNIKGESPLQAAFKGDKFGEDILADNYIVGELLKRSVKYKDDVLTHKVTP